MSHKKLRKAVQLSELRNKVKEQKEHFTTMNSKNETEFLELKNPMNEMNNALESIGNRINHREDNW